MPAPVTFKMSTLAPSATFATLSPLPPVRSKLLDRRDFTSERILATEANGLPGPSANSPEASASAIKPERSILIFMGRWGRDSPIGGE